MAKIITKNSFTSGSSPSGLSAGELAINVTDKKLFVGNAVQSAVTLFDGNNSVNTISGKTGTLYFYGGMGISSGFSGSTFFSDIHYLAPGLTGKTFATITAANEGDKVLLLRKGTGTEKMEMITVANFLATVTGSPPTPIPNLSTTISNYNFSFYDSSGTPYSATYADIKAAILSDGVVTSVNGATGAVTNVAFTDNANNFSVTQVFTSGLQTDYVTTDANEQTLTLTTGADNFSRIVIDGTEDFETIDYITNTFSISQYRAPSSAGITFNWTDNNGYLRYLGIYKDKLLDDTAWIIQGKSDDGFGDPLNVDDKLIIDFPYVQFNSGTIDLISYTGGINLQTYNNAWITATTNKFRVNPTAIPSGSEILLQAAAVQLGDIIGDFGQDTTILINSESGGIVYRGGPVGHLFYGGVTFFNNIYAPNIVTSVNGQTGDVTISVSGGGVSSFNGLTGAVQGVSAAVAGTGISVSGSTGAVTITNIGVVSFNGSTGNVTGVSSVNGSTGAITNVAFLNNVQTFSAIQSFDKGISASNSTASNVLDVIATNDGCGLRIAQDAAGSSARVGGIRLGRGSSNSSNSYIENYVGILKFFNGISGTNANPGTNMLQLSTTNAIFGVPIAGATFSSTLGEVSIQKSAFGANDSAYLRIVGTDASSNPWNFDIKGNTFAVANTVHTLPSTTGTLLNTSSTINATTVTSTDTNANVTQYITFVGGTGNTGIYIDRTTTPLTYNPTGGAIGAKKVTLTTSSNVITIDSATPNFVMTDGVNVSTFGLDSFAASYSSPFIISNSAGLSFQSNSIAFETGTGSYVFPKTNGSNGQVLTTNGTGTLSWGSVANLTTAQTFSALQSFSVGISAAGSTFIGTVSSDGGYKITSNAILAKSGTTYTFSSSDDGKIITSTNSSNQVFTIPSGLPVGFNCTIIQNGTAPVGFIGASGVTLQSFAGKTFTAGQYAAVSLIGYSTNIFNLAGGLTT